MLTRLVQLLAVLVMIIAAPLLAGSGHAQGDSLEPITPANVDRLELLDTIGTGQLYDIGLLDGGATLAAVTQDGIACYDAADLALIDVIAYTESPFTEDRGRPSPVPKGGASNLRARYEDTRVMFAWGDNLWTIDTATGEQTREALPADYIEPEPTVFSPDGQWEWSRDRDPATFQQVYMLKNTTSDEQIIFDRANCGGMGTGPTVVFSPDGSRLYTATGPMNGEIAAWDAATGEQIAAVGHYAVDGYGMAFTADSSTLLVARSYDRAFMLCPDDIFPGDGLHVYDLDAGTTTVTRFDPGVAPWLVATAPDGITVAVGARGPLVALENDAITASYTRLGEDDYPQTAIDIALSADGVYLAARYSDAVWVWERDALAGGEPLLVLEASESWGHLHMFALNYFMAFDGHILAYADFDVLRLVDVTTGQEIAALEHDLPIVDVTYAPDARRIAVRLSVEGVDPELLDPNLPALVPGQIVVWQLGDGVPEQVQAWEGIDGFEIVLTPDGTVLIVAAYRTSTVSFYDVDTGDFLRKVETPSLNDISISPDGTRLAAGSLAVRQITLWGVRE